MYTVQTLFTQSTEVQVYTRTAAELNKEFGTTRIVKGSSQLKSMWQQGEKLPATSIAPRGRLLRKKMILNTKYHTRLNVGLAGGYIPLLEHLEVMVRTPPRLKKLLMNTV